MFGIKFLLHKNLRRILSDYGFHGHALRKDFPLVGFVELRYDDLYQSIFVEPFKCRRTFVFTNLKILEVLENNLCQNFLQKLRI